MSIGEPNSGSDYPNPSRLRMGHDPAPLHVRSAPSFWVIALGRRSGPPLWAGAHAVLKVVNVTPVEPEQGELFSLSLEHPN